MLRKVIIFILTLSLMLGMLVSVVAEDQGKDDLDLSFENVSMNGVAVYQGRLILSMGYGSPKEVDLKTGEASDFLGITSDSWQEDEALRGSILISDGEALYGLDYNAGKLIPLTIEGEKLVAGEAVSIDLSSQRQSYEDGDIENSYMSPPENCFFHGGRLYLLFRDYDMNGPVTNLLNFDIKTGNVTTHEIEHLQSIAPYKDGQLIASIQDMNDSWDSDTRAPKNTALAVIDPESDSVTPLGDSGLPVGNGQYLAYDAEKDSIYILHKAEIHRWDGNGQTTLCAYLSTANFWGLFAGQMSLLPDGRIVVGSSEALNVRRLDPDNLPTGRITIYGGWEDDTHKRAVAALSGVPVRFLDDKWFQNAQELGQALISGEDEIDVMIVSAAHMDLSTIIRKGYALDLSDRPEMVSFADATYPMMQDVVKADGKLYAIPIEGDPIGHGYSVSGFEKLGVEPPKTFEAYCQFLANWEQDYGEMYPDTKPIRRENPYEDLVNTAFSVYTNEMARRGEEFSFSSPVLRTLLQQAEAVKRQVEDLAISGEDGPGVTVMSFEEGAMPSELFSNWFLGSIYEMGRPSNLQDSYRMKALNLAVSDGEEVMMPMELRVMFINPNSKNLEGAIKYVEAYIREMDAAKRTTLMPDENEPVENPNFEEFLKNLDAGVASLKQEIEKAEGAEKTQLEGYLEQYEKDRENMIQEMRYRITAEGIAEYREMMERVYINRAGAPYMGFGDSEDLGKLMQRYIQGNISMDQFLNEAEGKLRLMRLENQ